MTSIKEIGSEPERRAAFPVMRELRPHLDEAVFLRLLDEMALKGYRLFALRDGHGAITSLAGVAVLTNLYYGRHVWVFDLVTAGHARSKGHGARLLAFVEDFARENRCLAVALSSGLAREDAHRFYEREGYHKTSFVLLKHLTDRPMR
jgi:GNAT superfamily N-acetyltransferase